MQLCKEYLTCRYRCDCIFAKPCDEMLSSYDTCYNLVSEKNYIIYIRKEKLNKLNSL